MFLPFSWIFQVRYNWVQNMIIESFEIQGNRSLKWFSLFCGYSSLDTIEYATLKKNWFKMQELDLLLFRYNNNLNIKFQTNNITFISVGKQTRWLPGNFTWTLASPCSPSLCLRPCSSATWSPLFSSSSWSSSLSSTSAGSCTSGDWPSIRCPGKVLTRITKSRLNENRTT